jgi:hypothetical protein
MLKQLLLDNQELTKYLRSTQEICDRHNDVATASLSRTGSTKPSNGPGSSMRS